jgi:hypothetical protein
MILLNNPQIIAAFNKEKHLTYSHTQMATDYLTYQVALIILTGVKQNCEEVYTVYLLTSNAVYIYIAVL